jgi:hypothetical protein
MKAKLLLLTLLITTAVWAQTPYEKSMNAGMQLWQSGKNVEAIAQFGRIANAGDNNWIPAYYQALVTIVTAFDTSDMDAKNNLIQQATTILNSQSDQDNNPEWLVLKALATTAELTTDPSTKGQALSPKIIALYEKAKSLAPYNPRVILSLSEFQMQSKRYFHQDTSSECEIIKKALHLFDTQRSEVPFAPSWGRERAEQIISTCLSQ